MPFATNLSMAAPAITIYVDLDDWDAREGSWRKEQFAVRRVRRESRAARGCRRAGDGAVTLLFPVSDRTEHDTRGNVLTFESISVDPRRLTTGFERHPIRYRAGAEDPSGDAR